MNAASNIIPIIAKSDSEYVAFGDDSNLADVVLAFAFVIVPRKNIKEVETRIVELKNRFKIPQEASLHCKTLFHGDKRRKAGLSHLSINDVHSIVDKAINIINKNDVILRFAAAPLSFFEKIFTPEFEMTHTVDGTTKKFPAKADPKAILGFLMNACCVDVLGNIQAPKIADCEIIAAEEETKTELLIGKERKRADRHYQGFSDVGAPTGMVFQLQPNISTTSKAPILQLADIAAYICSHAFRNSPEDAFFGTQLSRVKKWIRHRVSD